MIYPDNFESKIGFDEVRARLKGRCLSTLGKSLVNELVFSSDSEQVTQWMAEIREMRRIREEEDDFPLTYFFEIGRAHV